MHHLCEFFWFILVYAYFILHYIVLFYTFGNRFFLLFAFLLLYSSLLTVFLPTYSENKMLDKLAQY